MILTYNFILFYFIFEINQRTLTHKLEEKKKKNPLLRFEKYNTSPFLLIFVTEYSYFLKDFLYQSLTMVSKKSIHIK